MGKVLLCSRTARLTRWSQLALLKSHLRDLLADDVSTSRMQQAPNHVLSPEIATTPARFGTNVGEGPDASNKQLYHPIQSCNLVKDGPRMS